MHDSASTPILSHSAKRLIGLIGLNRLARHPAAFVGVLLLLTVLVRPYSGFIHDARLYDLQVLNRITDGHFDGDLFLAYGSQDSYSLFSPIAAPLAKVFGVNYAFLFGYLLSLVLLIAGEVRLVHTLIPNRTLANVALVLLTVSQLQYGWGVVFVVHERFLTARLPAVAFSIWAITFALEYCWLRAGIALLLALGFHPLMSVAPMCVVGGLFLGQWMSPKTMCISAVAALSATALFVYSPLAPRFLSTMDPEWLSMVRLRSPHCVLSAWQWTDWGRVGFCLAIPLLHWRSASTQLRKLIILAVTTGVGGLILNSAAEIQGLALLLQGQGFRAMWLLSLLAVPLGMEVCRETLRSSSLRDTIVGVLVLAFLGESVFLHPHGIRLLPTVILWWGLCAIVIWVALLRSPLTSPVRIRRVLVGGLVGMLVVISVRFMFAVVPAANAFGADPIGYFVRGINACSELLLLVVGVSILGRMGRHTDSLTATGVRLGLTGACLAIAATVWGESDVCRTRYQPGFADLPFVKESIDVTGNAAVPNVYWPVEPPLIWNELAANSYFHQVQTAGVIFSKETAAEGARRGQLVRPFEIANMRRLDPNPIIWEIPLRVFGNDLSFPPPTTEDLLRLTADETLDFIILEDEFPGLYAATNGSVWIYDCRELRRRFGGPQLAGADDIR